MTVAEIIAAALSRGMKNRSSQQGDPELVDVVSRIQRILFAVGARVNRYYFATSESVAHDGTGWPRPSAAESVFRIEGEGAGAVAAGTEIVVVSVIEKDAEEGLPAVYPLGRRFLSAGNAADPTALDTILMLYSRIPDALPDDTVELDADYPRQFEQLVIDSLARYLAAKEGADRADEIKTLTDDIDAGFTLYVAHLEHAWVQERRSYAHQLPIHDKSLTPLRVALGGSA